MDISPFEDSIKLLGRVTVRRFTSLSGLLFCQGEILYTFAASARRTMCVDIRLTIFAARAISVIRPALVRHILQLCSRNNGNEMSVAWFWPKHVVDAVRRCGASNHTHSIIFGRQAGNLKLCHVPRASTKLGGRHASKSAERKTQAGIQERWCIVHAIHSVQDDAMPMHQPQAYLWPDMTTYLF